MLKSASFAKSVVGRTLKFFGAAILLDFHRPDMILYMFMLGVGCQMTDAALLMIYNYYNLFLKAITWLISLYDSL